MPKLRPAAVFFCFMTLFVAWAVLATAMIEASNRAESAKKDLLKGLGRVSREQEDRLAADALGQSRRTWQIGMASTAVSGVAGLILIVVLVRMFEASRTNDAGLGFLWRLLGATLPGAFLVLAGGSAVTEHWRDAAKSDHAYKQLFSDLGTHAVVLSVGLTAAGVYVLAMWQGVEAKLAAFFAVLSAVPLAIWGGKWALRVWLGLSWDRAAVQNDAAAWAARVIAPLTGALFLVFLTQAWRKQSRSDSPPLAPQQPAQWPTEKKVDFPSGGTV